MSSRKRKRARVRARLAAKAAAAHANVQPGRHPQANKPGRRIRERRKLTYFRRSIDLDYDALGRLGYGAYARLILDYVDWIEDRACQHTLAEQVAGPCDLDRVVGRVNRAIWRHHSTARALEFVHDRCLKSAEAGETVHKAGAPRALESCFGCIFSYPGPTEPDVSIHDAFDRMQTPRARDARQQLHTRLAALAGRYAR